MKNCQPHVKQRNIHGLTGVRGIAAIWVVLFHVHRLSSYFSLDYFNARVLQIGWAGVDLFFILSGFVLMHVHRDDFNDSIKLSAVVKFMKLRFFRVYPVATAALAIILLSTLMLPSMPVWYRSVHDSNDFTLPAFFKTLLLATRWIPPFKGDWNGPVWSLSVEILGYFAFPVLAYSVSKILSAKHLFVMLMLSISFPIAVFFWRHLQVENNMGILSIVRMFGFFCSGVVLYRLYEIFPNVSKRTSSVLCTAVIILAGLALWLNWPWLFPYAFALLIYCIALEMRWSEFLFSNPVSMLAGRLSFPLYLCHIQFLILGAYLAVKYQFRGIASLLILALCIILSVGLAWLLHVFIERPTHRWARKFGQQPYVRVLSKAG